jgi:uncharacterized protein
MVFQRFRRLSVLGPLFALCSHAVLEAQDFPGSAPATATALVGSWHAEATLPDGRLEVFLEIDAGGLVRVTSFRLGLRRVPLAGAQLAGRSVTLETPALGGRYHGTLSEDGSRMTGVVSQPSGPMLLDFRRVAAIPPRGQEPSRPLPYADEEVSFVEEKSGVRFHGTLTTPRGRGPHPAVVLIARSGGRDRDETIGDSRTFLVVADALTRSGVAVLRYDDRGFGKTGGNPLDATSEDRARDALAAAAWLAARPDVGPSPVGLVGHGEGGLVAMIAASRSPAIRFVATLAGFAEKGDHLAYQNLLALTGVEALGEPLRTTARDAVYRTVVVLKSDASDAEAAKQLAGFVPADAVPTLASRWMRFLVRSDPADAIEKVKVPILALYGEADPWVSATGNATALQAATRRSGNRNVTVVTHPRLDHQFQIAAPTAADGARCNDTIAPEVLEKLAKWVVETSGAR